MQRVSTLLDLLNTADNVASQRVSAAMLTMTRLDIAAIQRAYRGEA